MNPPFKPLLQALLVADHIYEDAATGKKIIAGVFHTMYRQAVESPSNVNEDGPVELQIRPAGLSMGSPFAYISLYSLRGRHSFVLRYVELGNDSVAFQTEFDLEYDDPLAPVEITVPLPPLPTNRDGVFALELLWDNEPMGACRIHVKSRRPEPEWNDDPINSQT